MTRIGDAKKALSQAILEEFEEFRDHLTELSETAHELEEDSTGINGVSTFWRGLHHQLQTLITTVEDRRTEVLASLSGKAKYQVRASVDPEHAERVEAQRGRAA